MKANPEINLSEILARFSIEKSDDDFWLVRPPEERLDRSIYAACKELIGRGLGGIWKGGRTQAFEFAFDPTEYMEILRSGQAVNLKSLKQFFPTPPEVIEPFLEQVGFAEMDRILEPNGGMGHIIDCISELWRIRTGNGYAPKEIQPDIYTYELDPFMQKILQSKPHVKVLGANYLETYHPEAFDLIAMNPPFAGSPYWKSLEDPKAGTRAVKEGQACGTEMEHIRKAYEDLAADGSILSVTSGSWLWKKDRNSEIFRDWMGFDRQEYERGRNDRFRYTLTWSKVTDRFETCFYVDKLPDNSFASSGTSVTTFMLRIDKYLRDGGRSRRDLHSVPHDHYWSGFSQPKSLPEQLSLF